MSVKFGPLTACFCGLGKTEIIYSTIKEYHDPQDCCEGCCAYGIGKVNKCAGKSGIRQHSLCSCCCNQRQIVITFNDGQYPSVCAYSYDKIVIAVNGDHYQALTNVFFEKVGSSGVGTVTI